MNIAIPAGIAIACSSWFTSWVASRFDSRTPPAWTQRRHAREMVSAIVIAIWMASLLLAGQAFLRFETGKESAAMFASGAAIAATGGVPALLGFAHPKSERERRRR